MQKRQRDRMRKNRSASLFPTRAHTRNGRNNHQALDEKKRFQRREENAKKGEENLTITSDDNDQKTHKYISYYKLYASDSM